MSAFTGASDFLPPVVKSLLHIYFICLQTLHESDMYCENTKFSINIVHTNSKFALKVHNTLIMN